MMHEPPEVRFWNHVTPQVGNECWLWEGSMKDGYGMMSVSRRKIPAHRFSYERFVGPVPPGMVIDHLCEVKDCVNPAHLEAVTSAENTRRGHPRRRASK